MGHPGACLHHTFRNDSYLAWHMRAERDYAHGITQTQCSACPYWLFPDEVGYPA